MDSTVATGGQDLMGTASKPGSPRRLRLAWALAALGLLAAVATAEAQGVILDNGVAQVGFRETANLGVEGLLPSTQACVPNAALPGGPQCNYVVGLREDSTNFEGLSGNCVCEGWGLSYLSPAPTSGWAQYGQPQQYAGLSARFFGPGPVPQSAVASARVGDLLITHEIEPEATTTTLFRMNVTIRNMGTEPVSDIVYRRVMDWDAEPTAYDEYVTISGSPTAITPPLVPELLCSTWDPWVSADPLAIQLDDPVLLPPVGPGTMCGGTSATFGAADRGAAFDFAARPLSAGGSIGTLPPGGYTRMLLYYGASRDSTVIADLVTINAQLVSIARPAYPQWMAPTFTGTLDPPVIGPFMTYAFAYKWECVPGLDPLCTPDPCADPNAPGCGPCQAAPCPPPPPPVGPPIADFDAAGDNGGIGANGEICSLTVNFTDRSTPGTNPIVAWHWDFGDGHNSIQQHPTHTYTHAGTYTVTLTVHDSDGNGDSDSLQVTVGECPPQSLEHPDDDPPGTHGPRDGRSGELAGMDSDGDSHTDDVDLCPFVADPGQEDTDGDLVGDACDGDKDGDGVVNMGDNCEFVANPDQRDRDQDAIGDHCDADLDGDGVDNEFDNCPEEPNRDQADADRDGVGDACEESALAARGIRGQGDASASVAPFPILVSPFPELALGSVGILALISLVLAFAARRRKEPALRR